MATKLYEVQTNTLADGYINCWLDCDDNPVRFTSRKQAMRELDNYISDCEAAVIDGELVDFESDLIIVKVLT